MIRTRLQSVKWDFSSLHFVSLQILQWKAKSTAMMLSARAFSKERLLICVFWSHLLDRNGHFIFSAIFTNSVTFQYITKQHPTNCLRCSGGFNNAV